MKKQSENEFLYAKLEDKIRFCETRNKITHTDFFTEPEIIKIEKYLHSIKYKNYFIFGGYEDSNRKMIFFYPEKLNFTETNHNLTSNINNSNIISATPEINSAVLRNITNNVLEIIRITLPKNQIGTYEHRDYLSAIMKFGIVREKFGDIIVYPEGADFIVQKENSQYFKDNLIELTRFQKSKIEILDISNLHENCQEVEEISIIVNSMRIDNFITEICHCSRNKAEEILLQERVMINYEPIFKNSKEVKINDIITIRGFGRFVVKDFSRKTKSGKNVIILEHNR